MLRSLYSLKKHSTKKIRLGGKTSRSSLSQFVILSPLFVTQKFLVFLKSRFTKGNLNFLVLEEAVVQRCSVKKVFLEISQNSQENTFSYRKPLVAASYHLRPPKLFGSNKFNFTSISMLRNILPLLQNNMKSLKKR